jgi:hypothetical protein
MPLDHYISQVHLKNFYSPKLGNAMYAIRKCELKIFQTSAASACRIENGSTNSYLQSERTIEEFLKDIEPRYNGSCDKLRAGNIDHECIYVIAGFVSYILSCSPAGMRLQAKPLRAVVEETSRLLDHNGSIPPPPPELGGKNLTELLNSGSVYVEIDPKYPQAIGISSILESIRTFGNFGWEILINPFDDNPFFTSDFPIAIEKSLDPRFLNKVASLAPNLAIRIHPDLSCHDEHTDYSFSKFRYKIRTLSLKEVMQINTLLVRCAETVVYFRDSFDWIPRFVKNNARYRLETRVQGLPYGSGTLLWSRQVCLPC